MKDSLDSCWEMFGVHPTPEEALTSSMKRAGLMLQELPAPNSCTLCGLATYGSQVCLVCVPPHPCPQCEASTMEVSAPCYNCAPNPWAGSIQRVMSCCQCKAHPSLPPHYTCEACVRSAVPTGSIRGHTEFAASCASCCGPDGNHQLGCPADTGTASQVDTTTLPPRTPQASRCYRCRGNGIQPGWDGRGLTPMCLTCGGTGVFRS